MDETSASIEASGGSIKQWSEDERPREKLIGHGEQALTNAELLAILIGSGTPRKSAVALMREVLKDCDDKLLIFSRMTLDELMRYKGIGTAKAVVLKAAAEFGRRRVMENMAHDCLCLAGSDKVYEYMLPLVRDLGHEECWALMLNNSARLLKRVHVSSGGRCDTSVDIRMVLKSALLSEATSLILVHNHPSGSVRPSGDDNRLTERLKEAAKLLNIHLLDHVIVTDGDYYSYADNQRL